MKFGAHISTAKPFSESIIRAKKIGCDCMQIFANPPQRWNPIPISDEEINKFKLLKQDSTIGPIVIHSIYLVNFASSNPFFYEQSIKSLIDDMKKANLLGAIGANTHLGSTKGTDWKDCLPKVRDAINKILAETENADFIIENAAGAGNIIGDTLEEIAEIIQSVNSSRVKVLIDTAHAFESGYNLKDLSEAEKFIDNFDGLIGLDKLVGFHFNDSQTQFDSHRDRHADIGEGELGLDIFKFLINHPKLINKFAILETPQDKIDWKDQIKLLRSLEYKK